MNRAHSLNSFAGARGRLVGATLATLLALPPVLSAETVDQIKKTLQVEPGGTLVVNTAGAKIDVSSAPGNEVRIDIERKISGSSKEAEEKYLEERKVTIEQDGNRVIIRQAKPDKASSFWNLFKHVSWKNNSRFTIVVPRQFSADLDTSGGSIEVRELDGDVRADTSGGSIKCENINGKVDADTSGGSISFYVCHGDAIADTSGGSITAEDGTGKLSLDTSGGSIRVRNQIGDVSADTSGGSITLDGIDGNVTADTSGGSIHATLLAQPTKPCRLSTSGGGIDVSVPGSAALDLDASTSGGRVHSEFAIAGYNMEKKTSHMQGPINGGGPLLHLRTSGGGIRVTKSES